MTNTGKTRKSPLTTPPPKSRAHTHTQMCDEQAIQIPPLSNRFMVKWQKRNSTYVCVYTVEVKENFAKVIML